jgi:hypothetical protein
VIRLRGEDIAWRDVDGEIVVLDLRTSRYLQVNASGAAVWPMLVSGASMDSLSEALQAAFDLDPARASRDVATFIDTLRARDLVVDVGDRS